LAALVAGPTKPDLRDFTPLLPDSSPFVSVILPARNEEHNLGRCVRSLLASGYPSFEVIVVDDRSTDATGAMADHLAAADPRLRVVHGAERPDDWFGKPWACWQGFEQSKGALLLFTDADTAHGPELLPRAVAALTAEHVDLVTVMPRQEMIGFWERVVQPFFFLMLGLRFGTPGRINRNRNPRHAIANGQFILVTRESYEAVGGHRAVKDTVIEDLMMAVTYLKAGKRHLFAIADRDMTTRMYTTLPSIVEGWSKNFFMGHGDDAVEAARLRRGPLGTERADCVSATARGAGAGHRDAPAAVAGVRRGGLRRRDAADRAHPPFGPSATAVRVAASAGRRRAGLDHPARRPARHRTHRVEGPHVLSRLRTA
jgi:glycosyltransferase involved in cell wall biosynthesis